MLFPNLPRPQCSLIPTSVVRLTGAKVTTMPGLMMPVSTRPTGTVPIPPILYTSCNLWYIKHFVKRYSVCTQWWASFWEPESGSNKNQIRIRIQIQVIRNTSSRDVTCVIGYVDQWIEEKNKSTESIRPANWTPDQQKNKHKLNISRIVIKSLHWDEPMGHHPDMNRYWYRTIKKKIAKKKLYHI